MCERTQVCVRGLAILFILGMGSQTVRAQNFSAHREYEPVVVAGSALSDWVGSADETRITLHVMRNGVFVPIPFQVDKRRKIHTNYNVATTDASYLATNCELGYYAELHNGPSGEAKADFTSNTLQSTDEFVFLLKDVLSNTSRASTSAWLGDSGVGTDRYEISLFDPVAQAYRYVYAFLWSGSPPSNQIDSTDYIQWTPDNIPGCPSSAEACSFVTSNSSSALSDVATLDTHFSANWATDALQIRNHGSDGTPQSDLLDRMRYSADGETEDQWSNGGSPEFLGHTDGRIRVVRAVEGAKSGRQTTKYEFIYPTMLVTRVNLRVHNLSYLQADFDHEDAFAGDAMNQLNAGYIWSGPLTDPPSVPSTFLDEVDGSCVIQGGTCHPAQFEFGDWVQTSSPIRGEYVHLFQEVRAVPLQSTGNRTTQYTDHTGQTTSTIADFERKWTDTACTDDSIAGNISSCDDPEGESLFFARFESTVIPYPKIGSPNLSTSVVAADIAYNLLQNPVQQNSLKQSRDVPPPTPGNPCTPTLTADDPHTGAARLNFGPSIPCGGSVGLGIFRAEGSGAFVFVKNIPLAASWIDHTTFAGQSYSYRTVAYNQGNVRSNVSNTVTITPVDTTAPPTPSGLQGSAQGTVATLTLQAQCTHDLAGLNFYAADVSGGPYTKLNSSPVSVASQPFSWSRAGLQANHTYFFVATAVDFSGNESGYSAQVTVQTGSN